MIGRYSVVALALSPDNIAKHIEATHSRLKSIMPPRGVVPIPAPRPGYGSTPQPSWCDIGESCDAALCRVTQKQQGVYLPPRQRPSIVFDSSVARLS